MSSSQECSVKDIKVVSRPCQVGNTIFHKNAEVKMYWSRIVLRWGADKNQKPVYVAGAYQPSRWAANIFQGIQALGKFGLCSGLLAGDH